MGNYIDNFDQKLKVVAKARYQRGQYQSYMTAPEWRNVEMVEEYAAFLQRGESMFRFPYFGQVVDLWRILFNSYRSARKHNKASAILTSEYMMMDLFITVFTSFELLPRGIFALMMRPFLRKENNTEVQKMIAGYYTESAKKLQTVPFYDHDYRGIRQELLSQYKACHHKTWGDWFSWKCLSTELILRRWLSMPLRYWFHQEGNQAPATTDILVKLHVQSNNIEEAKNALLAKLDGSLAAVVDNHVYVKDKNPKKDYTSVYACVAVPRYMAFKETLQQFSASDIQVRKMAGQDHVQVKLLVDNVAAKIIALNPLYSYGDRINAGQKTVLIDVPVRELQNKIKELADHEEVKAVRFIHNF